MNGEDCSTCRFFDDTGDASGYCRRYPPVIVQFWNHVTGDIPSTEEIDDVTRFPVTYVEHWCGEYQPKVEPKP